MKVSLFDTHTHVNFPEFVEDSGEVIERALAAGVAMVNVGVDMETSEKAVALAESFEGLYAAVGVHPNDYQRSFEYQAFKSLAGEGKVVAIGETGLDFFRVKDKEGQERQRELFLYHLTLAKEAAKPLIIHCRDAYREVYDMLKKEAMHLSGFVVHSFCGSVEDAKRFLSLGGHVSFNGIITFTKDYDDVVKHVPMDRVLLETDAPFLTPEPHRGKRNEPSYIAFVAERFAELKKLPKEEVADATTLNAAKFFKLPVEGNTA